MPVAAHSESRTPRHSAPTMKPADRQLWKRFWALASPYWRQDEKWKAWGLLALLVILLLGQTRFAVLFIEQTGEFTSALAARDEERFWSAIKLLPRPARRGGADLRLLLLRARHARHPLAALADQPLSRQLLQPPPLLRAERQRRHRQPRPAGRRGHRHLHPAFALLPAGHHRLDAATGRLQHGALVDLARTGLFPRLLCQRRDADRHVRLRAAADEPQLQPVAARGGFPLQPGARARKRRVDRLLPRRGAGAEAGQAALCARRSTTSSG